VLLGSRPYLWRLADGGRVLGQAYGVLRRGRLRADLLLTVAPGEAPDDRFWRMLQQFMSKQGVTGLTIQTIALGGSPSPPPQLSRETSRFAGQGLYVMDLTKPAVERPLSANNQRNINKARKAGVRLVDLPAEQALQAHHTMTGASLHRRTQRGEGAAAPPATTTAALLASGSARLYQAALGDEVLSSKLVFTLGPHAFYFDGGSSQQGMQLGSSHFLMAQVIESHALRGFKTLNLGVAASTNPGLIRFKEGFSADRWEVCRAVSQHGTAWRMVRNAVLSLLR
jgi:Acetyltransferase (GNAT) domain